jgi:hypothetical protein
LKLEHPTPPVNSVGINKLKGCAMLATKFAVVVSATIDAPFYVLVCKYVLFSLEDIATTLS